MTENIQLVSQKTMVMW